MYFFGSESTLYLCVLVYYVRIVNIIQMKHSTTVYVFTIYHVGNISGILSKHRIFLITMTVIGIFHTRQLKALIWKGSTALTCLFTKIGSREIRLAFTVSIRPLTICGKLR